MSQELGLEGTTKQKVLENVKNIHFINFYLPRTITRVNIIKFAKIDKFSDLITLLTNNKIIVDAADSLLQKSIFFYHDSFTVTVIDNTFGPYLVPLEEAARDAFCITKSLIYLEDMYKYVDNYENPDLANDNIKKSNVGLRGIKIQLCKAFYMDLIKMFLNLTMDFYYNISTMKPSGYMVEECALMAADLCWDLKNSYEQKFILENYGNAEVINDIKDDLKLVENNTKIEKPAEKPAKKPAKKSTKKKDKKPTTEKNKLLVEPEK